MIVVPYTTGSATPSQIASTCTARGHATTFVVDPTDPDSVGHIGLLKAFGEVVEAVRPVDAVTALAGTAMSAVVTFADSTLATACALATAHGLPGHRPETIELLTDKWLQRNRLNACGVGSVATVAVRGGQPLDQLGRLPLPGVLKPREGSGSRDTLFVQSAPQVADELARHPSTYRFVVEERIHGTTSPLHPRLADYVSAESAVVDGNVVHLGFTGRLPLAEPARERGLVFPVGPEPALANELREMASAAITALGVSHGLVHTEIKIGADGPQVIEVNARLGGGLGSIVPAAGGPDLVGLAVDLALGSPVHRLCPASGVALHLYVQPPYGATRLLRAPDASALRALPGVYGVDRRARLGDRVDWRSGSADRILDVWVTADALDDLLHRAEAIECAVANTTEWTFA